jgi:hypothetical protein
MDETKPMNVIPPFPPDPTTGLSAPGSCPGPRQDEQTSASSAGAADANVAAVYRVEAGHGAAARTQALATEARTLRERLVVARARAQALEQKSRAQADDLEKYHQALAGATEALRRQQNLAASYPLHVGGLLAQRGRWLVAEYRRRGPAGRLRLLPRISEFLDFQGVLAAAAHLPADWAAVKAELETARAVPWLRRLLGGGLRRGLARLTRPLRRAS